MCTTVGSTIAKSTMGHVDIPWDPMCTMGLGTEGLSGHADIPWDPMCTMGLWDGMDRGTAQHGLDIMGSHVYHSSGYVHHGYRHPMGSHVYHGTMGRDEQRDCTV